MTRFRVLAPAGSRRAVSRAVAVALTAAIAVAACGGSISLSAGARSTLANRVAAVKAAVAHDDQSGATDALAALRTAVADLETQHQLSAARAASILSAAVEVEAQLPTLPTTTTMPTLPPDTGPPAPSGHHHKGPGGGGGNEG